MKIDNSKLANLMGSGGLLFGLFYAMKKNKGLAITSVYALGFGLVGMVVGNQISKFYEN
jgi:xanthosine utilization system XapX-like protein